MKYLHNVLSFFMILSFFKFEHLHFLFAVTVVNYFSEKIFYFKWCILYFVLHISCIMCWNDMWRSFFIYTMTKKEWNQAVDFWPFLTFFRFTVHFRVCNPNLNSVFQNYSTLLVQKYVNEKGAIRFFYKKGRCHYSCKTIWRIATHL